IKIFRDIFRRRVDDFKRRLIVQKLVIHAAHHVSNRPLQVREIVKQADRIELRPFKRDSDLVIVAVHVLALPLVSAQGVPRGKTLVNADLKHPFPLKYRDTKSGAGSTWNLPETGPGS